MLEVRGLLPAFIVLGVSSAVAAALALASQWLFPARARSQANEFGSRPDSR